MSNFKSSINKYGDKYRVDFSYISPDGKRHRTCKRGFSRQKDAVRWQKGSVIQRATVYHHYSHSYESSGKEVAEMLNKIMEEMSDVSKELGQ